MMNSSGGNPFRDLNRYNISAGIIAGIMGVVSLPVIIIQAAASAGYSIYDAVAWIFSIYVMGGLLCVLMALYYRMPIVGANSLGGIAFLATVTPHFSFRELIGACIVSGFIILLLGLTGIFKKLIDHVPREIISAMLAGMITPYMIHFVISVSQLAIVGGVTLLVFLMFSKFSLRIPPMAAAMAAGFVIFFITHPIEQGVWSASVAFPQFIWPELNMVSIISVSVPLALIILSNDVAVGVSALEQNGYRPPINRLISLSGIFSLLAPWLGGTSANVAGMMSAIVSDSSSGPKHQRYMGAFVTGVILLAFGLFAWKIVPLLQSFPEAFVSILLGISLLAVFGNSLAVGFSNPALKLSTTITFMISASSFSIFSISAPVWALLAGTLIAMYIEKYDDRSKITEQRASTTTVSTPDNYTA